MATGSAVLTTDALLDAIGRHDAGAAADLMAGGTLSVDNLAIAVDDPQDVRDLLADVFAALPDLSVQPVRTFAADDRLAIEVVVTGTLTGELRGTKPTGRAAELFGRAVIDLTNDRRTVSLFFDRETAVEQLGLDRDGATPGRGDGSELLAALSDDPWWRQRAPHETDAPAATTAPAPISAAAVAAVGPTDAPVTPREAAHEPAHEAAHRSAGRRWGPIVLTFLTAIIVLAVVAGGALLLADGRDTPSQTLAAPVVVPPPAPPSEQTAPGTGLDPAVTTAATPEPWANKDLFVIGSTTLRPGAHAKLVALADRMIAAGSAGTVTVTGYTDDVGSEQRNLALSQTRADVVGAELRTALAGTDWTVDTVGAGEANPRVPNDTYANQAKNRRIEVVYRPS